MNVDSLGQALDVFRGSYLLPDEHMCVNFRARGVICRACETACGPRAVTLAPDEIGIDERACTNCGACVPACPAGAMRLSVFDPARFAAAIPDDGDIHVHCSESKDGGGGIVVPCHLVIDARLAGAVTEGGARTLVLHARPGCRDCSKADAAPHADELMIGLRRWFGETDGGVRWARPGETAGSEAADHHDQVRANRRNFLRLAGARAMAGIAWMVPAAPEAANPMEEREIRLPGVYARKPVIYQQSLAERIAALPWQPRTLLPWFARRFEENCTLCAACSERCPTGALALRHEADRLEITFLASLCTNCGLCSAVCPEGAVRSAALKDWREAAAPRAVLVSREVAECSRCRQTFRAEAGTNVCPSCRNEAAMDDEWVAMLGG